MAVAQVGLDRRPAGATGASILRPRNLALAACVLIAGWLVFVPLAALFWWRVVQPRFQRGQAELMRSQPVVQLESTDRP